jgi:hypothetical protein
MSHTRLAIEPFSSTSLLDAVGLSAVRLREITRPFDDLQHAASVDS